MVKGTVTTVILTANTPKAIRFSAAYPYYWIDNKSSGNVYVSTSGTPEVDTDGTYTVASGAQLRISGGPYDSDIVLLGDGKVQVIASGIAESPFKSAPTNGGGESVKEVSGASSYTVDAVDYPIIGLNLYGKSTQDGTPTPDTPVDIVSVGDSRSVEVTACGKNMLDVSNCINATNVVSDVSNGIILFKKVTEAQWSNTYIGKFYYKKGTKITISSSNITYGRFGLSSSNTRYPSKVYNSLIYTDTGKPVDSILNRQVLKTTIKLDYEGVIYVWFCSDTNISNAEEFLTTLQVEIGSAATNYEPYKANTASITTALPLCGIPVDNNGNYTDSNGQQWVCDELVYNADGMRKIVKRISKIDSYDSETVTEPYLSTTGSLTTGATVIYQLAEPQEINLTATEVSALSQLQTYSGVTNIFNSGGANMDVKFCTNKMLSEYVAPITTGLQAQIDELKAAVLSLGGNV